MTATTTKSKLPAHVTAVIDHAVSSESDGGKKVTKGEAALVLNVAGSKRTQKAAAQELRQSAKTKGNLTAGAKDVLDAAVPPKAARVQATQGPARTDVLSDIAARDAKKAAVDELANDPTVRLALMDPAMVRTEGYQKFVEKIQGTDLYRTYHKDVRSSLCDEIDHIISGSEISGTLVDKTNANDPDHLHQFTTKLYDLVQETALAGGIIGYEGGPDAVELKVISDTKPNAYVYGFWNEKPRVHMIDTIVDVFFDNDKGDWVNDEAKAIVQSVIGHELWHIKDSPAEWRTWFGILLEASGLMEGHEDGPMFTAEQKTAMVASGRKLVSDENRKAHTDCKAPCCATGFQQFVADPKLSKAAGNIGDKLKISPEKATQALVEAFGIDVDNPKYRGIERDEKGKPTKFGLGQMIFQDSYQLTRAGEIAADRGAFLIQGTNQWTALMDKLLGTATNLNNFGDSAAEKTRFVDKVVKQGYADWAKRQSRSLAQNAKAFNVAAEMENLHCVSHPPSLPRVMLGAQYMDRFSNPDAFPLLVKELMNIEDPTVKAMELIRALQRGMHQEVTRFVDPRGFDKADATARVMHGIHYTAEGDRWQTALQSAFKVLDDLLPDSELAKQDSDVFEKVESAIDVSSKRDAEKLAIPAWGGTPMEAVTKHLIQRLEGLKSHLTGDAAEVVSDRLSNMWDLHKDQLAKGQRVFEEPTKGSKEMLDRLFEAMGNRDDE